MTKNWTKKVNREWVNFAVYTQLFIVMINFTYGPPGAFARWDGEIAIEIEFHQKRTADKEANESRDWEKKNWIPLKNMCDGRLSGLIFRPEKVPALFVHDHKFLKY